MRTKGSGKLKCDDLDRIKSFFSKDSILTTNQVKVLFNSDERVVHYLTIMKALKELESKGVLKVIVVGQIKAWCLK